MKNAIVILFENFEEIEALTPVDILRRAQVDTLTASLDGSKLVRGRSAISVEADAKFSDISQNNFDAVIIPGGAGVLQAAENAELLDFVKRHFDAGKLVCAICAAPVLLKNAGVLDGRKFTSHFSVVDRLPSSDQSKAVVRDGNLITSRGAGTALEFSLSIAAYLQGDCCAEEIAGGISI